MESRSIAPRRAPSWPVELATRRSTWSWAVRRPRRCRRRSARASSCRPRTSSNCWSSRRNLWGRRSSRTSRLKRLSACTACPPRQERDTRTGRDARRTALARSHARARARAESRFRLSHSAAVRCDPCVVCVSSSRRPGDDARTPNHAALAPRDRPKNGRICRRDGRTDRPTIDRRRLRRRKGKAAYGLLCSIPTDRSTRSEEDDASSRKVTEGHGSVGDRERYHLRGIVVISDTIAEIRSPQQGCETRDERKLLDSLVHWTWLSLESICVHDGAKDGAAVMHDTRNDWI